MRRQDLLRGRGVGGDSGSTRRVGLARHPGPTTRRRWPSTSTSRRASSRSRGRRCFRARESGGGKADGAGVDAAGGPRPNGAACYSVGAPELFRRDEVRPAVYRADVVVPEDASARVNTRENVRLTFDPKVEDRIQEIVETNFDLYKRITDDPEFGRAGRPVRRHPIWLPMTTIKRRPPSRRLAPPSMSTRTHKLRATVTLAVLSNSCACDKISG